MTLYLTVKFVPSWSQSWRWEAALVPACGLTMRNPANVGFAFRTAKFLDEFLTRPGLIVLLERRFEIAGGASGLMIVAIVWLMVTKPT